MAKPIDTTDVYSSHAFVILMERPWVDWVMRLGRVYLERGDGEVLVRTDKGGPLLGRGPTVRAAMQAANQFVRASAH